MSSSVAKKYSYRSSVGRTTGNSADISIEYSADLSALTRLEDKIRLMQEDLETERELRARIEREKADLSVQVISMSERLEEAEGGAENQFVLNRNRDVELAKLRKLVDEVHLESEETHHILKKKHTEVMADFQEQIDLLTKAKSRAEKEKAKFQAELYELLAQVDSLNKDKFIQIKTIEKLEVSITDLSVRIEELNRTIIDVTAHKTRIASENIELIKEVQDLKINIENVTYSRSQVAMQLDDTTRKLEDENRRRSTLESQLHQVGLDLDSVRTQLDEESEIRLDLERQLVKVNGDVQIWRNKYETEAAARVEELEEVRRKYSARIQEQEEHIESLLLKLTTLEKVKSRLQTEVEVLIIDLEKSNNTCRELNKRVEQFERTTVELKTRLDEVTVAYDQAQRDLRNRVAEIQRLNHELEKAADSNAQLGRENKKLGDENREFRSTLSEMTRRLHESDLEIRRLETERDELNAAYKEAEAARRAEEKRAQALASEFGQYRHDAERRLLEKDEEIEVIRKQTAIEIEQLNSRLIEAETKLKTEITRIKKKMMITITELEMSLDVANKTNIDLQKTIKKQSLQLTEIQAHYDDIQRQLQQTLDQYSVAQRRISSLVAEVDEVRSNYEVAMRGKKQAEIACEEAGTKITELSSYNVSLVSIKNKLEQELSTIASDYEEVSRELRASDERYQKVQVELKSTIELLHDEQERIIKIETIKKSLEVEVKNLSVRLEEVETNAVVGAKRIISKMEARIRDLELELEEEKRRHAETIKILRKKERTVKEIMIQCEEDQKNVLLLQESLDKATQKITIYKRQLNEQEGMSATSVSRARRYQRELEAAEDRADHAETNLNMVRAKHRSFVTTSTVPGGAVYVVESTRTIVDN